MSKLQVLKHVVDDEGLTEGSASLVAEEIATFAPRIGVEFTTLESPQFSLGELGNPRAKFSHGISEYAAVASDRLEGELLHSANSNIRIFSVGGNHLRAVELIGYLRACHRLNLEPLILWIDAHPDFNTPETSKTGNIHGMVSSLLFGEGPEELNKLLGDTPPLKPQNIIYVGINQQDRKETARLREKGITVKGMDSLEATPGNSSIIDEIQKRIAEFGRPVGVWAEVDVDVLNRSEFPAAVMDNSNGMRVNQLQYLILELSRQVPLLGMGVCEIAPQKDVDGSGIGIVRDLAFALQGIENTSYEASLSDRASLHGPEGGTSRLIRRGKELISSALGNSGVAAALAASVVGLSAFLVNRGSKTGVTPADGGSNLRVLNHDAQYAYSGIATWNRFVPLPFQGGDLTSENLMTDLIRDFLDSRSDRSRDALLSYFCICERQGIERWNSLERFLSPRGVEGRQLAAQIRDDYLDFRSEIKQRDVGDFARLWGAEKI